MGKYKVLHFIVVCGDCGRCGSAGVGELQGGKLVRVAKSLGRGKQGRGMCGEAAR